VVPLKAWRRTAHWSLLTTLPSLVGALTAIGSAFTVALRPVHGNTPSATAPAPTHTDQQVVDADADIRTAHGSLRQVMVVNTNKQVSAGDDFAARYTNAANRHLSFYGGGKHLLDRFAAEPATPPNLANAIKLLAAKFRGITNLYLSESSESPKHLLPDRMEHAAAPVDWIWK
jgi:hypothetical protein